MDNRDEVLAEVGALFVKEFEAWQARNKTRAALRSFLYDYRQLVDEYFDREIAETDDVYRFDALKKENDAAQRKLATARAATRRAAKRIAGSEVTK